MTHSLTRLSVRPLRHEDVPAAWKIQSQCYPDFLIEGEEAFASRLDLPLSYCLAATIDGDLCGYLLAHGWPAQSPPELAKPVSGEEESEVLLIHDLAVAPAGRGLAIGKALIERAFSMAAADGLRTAELIAVQGAAPYWSSLGFVEAKPDAELASRLAAYGDDAVWMTRSMASDSKAEDTGSG
ncbi:ribosomal protein S18 acetylase RimI-like enzyme [Altererythrobacter atlanticus]|uniref:Acetyltransferase (GNAT) family protein n=1 Tax=Croceibacterium atlanticum TaxID=1267766 RepID=A0A0F7KRK0_9SPHN|nr:GNAT family N-acetyltransferase [Croceibacterium atlanticum]AKH41375.1 Acetyltransferase (GNAT) family protein [Croceibacterium atlanticum]MBB5732836.1 ribosomal protein S18 acetylase RimI-like enzyme [Croceibacterium atlanticum]